MKRFLPDTSCLIALLCSWHEHHERTRKALETRINHGEQLILAGHSLMETYSVLTRLPYPFRLSEQNAMELLWTNWKKATIIALTSREYWQVLKNATERGLGGGQIYDGVIASCARKGKATVLITWNLEHFGPFEDGSLTCTTPV